MIYFHFFFEGRGNVSHREIGDEVKHTTSLRSSSFSKGAVSESVEETNRNTSETEGEAMPPPQPQPPQPLPSGNLVMATSTKVSSKFLLS